MSQIGPSTSSLNQIEGLPITSLTLLIILLIPCVVLLLLLNCLFLGYKLLLFSKKNRKKQRSDSENTLLQSTFSTRQRISRISEAPLFSNKDGKITYISVSEPMLSQPVSSSRTSSKERAAVDQRFRFLRPDGATGGVSETLRASSTSLATKADCTSRFNLPRRSRMCSRNKMNWSRSAPLVLQSSDSEAEIPNLVPPNSPAVPGPQSRITPEPRALRRSSTMELQNVLNNAGDHHFDMVEYASSIALETSCFVASVNSSTVGPGLDSDFGASAGVSLRILSADSDGLTNSGRASGMEWDCYDPCYVREKHIPKQKHYIPALHTKNYWV
ncbi:protein huluwa isoform X1 [Esox lucius]|uniref:protein huluwa isoform X1 n=1 Tax=Esox lucius TaxID=8010 RepID=UPI0014770586|nr:protein huluwa isoform X1 [Esox lucius]